MKAAITLSLLAQLFPMSNAICSDEPLAADSACVLEGSHAHSEFANGFHLAQEIRQNPCPNLYCDARQWEECWQDGGWCGFNRYGVANGACFNCYNYVASDCSCQKQCSFKRCM